MKILLVLIITLLLGNTIHGQVYLKDQVHYFHFSKADSMLIKKNIKKINKKWENLNKCIGEDSVRLILDKSNVYVIPLFFLDKKINVNDEVYLSIIKNKKYPIFSILLSYNNKFIGECQYCAISRKYKIVCSSTIDKEEINTRYYDIECENFYIKENIFGITTNYMYPKFEQYVFFEDSMMLYAVDFYEKNTTKKTIVDKSFFSRKIEDI